MPAEAEAGADGGGGAEAEAEAAGVPAASALGGIQQEGSVMSGNPLVSVRKLLLGSAIPHQQAGGAWASQQVMRGRGRARGGALSCALGRSEGRLLRHAPVSVSRPFPVSRSSSSDRPHRGDRGHRGARVVPDAVAGEPAADRRHHLQEAQDLRRCAWARLLPSAAPRARPGLRGAHALPFFPRLFRVAVSTPVKQRRKEETDAIDMQL